jgi:hypothetical protein
MQDQLESNSGLKKIRWLSHALIISGALNIGFLGTFFIMTFKNLRRPAPKHALQNIEESVTTAYVSSSGIELLSEYFEYSYEQLRKELECKELVEDGYTKRDYALACLVAFHYFDIYKALSGMALQTRALEIVHKEGGERMRLEVFPGLQDAHFDALLAFSRVEKWPFTPQGLYVKLQQLHPAPNSLQEAFYLTQHFHLFWRLFHKTGVPFLAGELLQGLLQVDWECLDGFYRDLIRSQDFSEESRRKFLVQLMQKKVSFAARVFLEHDREFALTKLDDESMIYLLSQVDSTLPKAEHFARQLLVSVRSDGVLRSAGLKLYELAGEKPPATYDHTQDLMRFLPNFFQKSDFVNHPARRESESVIPLMTARRCHLVIKGDTLWQIAVDYHVSLKDLMKVNHLTASSVIKPGMKLEIP